MFFKSDALLWEVNLKDLKVNAFRLGDYVKTYPYPVKISNAIFDVFSLFDIPLKNDEDELTYDLMAYNLTIPDQLEEFCFSGLDIISDRLENLEFDWKNKEHKVG